VTVPSWHDIGQASLIKNQLYLLVLPSCYTGQALELEGTGESLIASSCSFYHLPASGPGHPLGYI